MAFPLKHCKSLPFSLFTYNSSDQLSLVTYNANEESFGVTSTLVVGQKEVVLIDAQFTKSDAHRVVAEILATKKQLKAVYITYGDPDFYFGLEVIKQAFPSVPVYAAESTVEKIKSTNEKKLEFWGPKLGVDAPTEIIVPQVLKGDSIELEGHALKIISLPNYDRNFVYIADIKAIIGGIAVYSDLHLWTADASTSEKLEKWSEILTKMEELNPDVVVPGHMSSDAPTDVSSVKFSKDYLAFYVQAIPNAHDSAALISVMRGKYPNAGLNIALELGAKVHKGEMKW